jgi:hypothetical protein
MEWLDGVWFDNWIYWTLTGRNYRAIANSHTQQYITARTKSSGSSVFTSRCLVTASKAVDPSTSVFTSLLVGDCVNSQLTSTRLHELNSVGRVNTSPNSFVVASHSSNRTDRVEKTASCMPPIVARRHRGSEMFLYYVCNHCYFDNLFIMP